MGKYERTVEALRICAKSECSKACPYHEETKGGRSCRAWLCIDAAIAIEALATENENLQIEIGEMDVMFTRELEELKE